MTAHLSQDEQNPAYDLLFNCCDFFKSYEKYNLFFWLSLAMIPNLIGAMCAITWHIYDNQENLYGLVSLQGIFTFIGNSTLALAAIKIFRGKDTYE